MAKASKARNVTKYAYLHIVPVLQLFKKCTVIKKNNLFTPKFQTSSVTINNFPILYDQHNKVVLPVVFHFFDLKLHKFQKSLTQTANALLYYWRFLENESLRWDDFSATKYDRPTYLFRSALQRDMQRGVISPSTASSYMNYVIKFYAWAISAKLLSVQKNSRPFEYEEIIVNKSSQNRASGIICACTTDLRIRVPKMQAGTMRPLTSEQLKILMQALLQEHIELRLMIQLALLTGMRQGEICSLTESWGLTIIRTVKYCKKVEVILQPLNGQKEYKHHFVATTVFQKLLAKDTLMLNVYAYGYKIPLYIQRDARINIRTSSVDVEHIKLKAAYEGLPYQTLIASILHKYAAGHIGV